MQTLIWHSITAKPFPVLQLLHSLWAAFKKYACVITECAHIFQLAGSFTSNSDLTPSVLSLGQWQGTHSFEGGISLNISLIIWLPLQVKQPPTMDQNTALEKAEGTPSQGFHEVQELDKNN